MQTRPSPAPHDRTSAPWFTLAPEAVLATLGTGQEGLSDAEAAARLEMHGPNEVTAGKSFSSLLIFFRQFTNLLILILLTATAVSVYLGERLDAAVILVIVLACVALGFVQEYRAEKAAAALARLAAPTATVVREGQELTIPSREVVPGDLLLLLAGDRVAADGRLLLAVNLKADEALLTGESRPVHKSVEAVAPDTPVAERHCMVFGGTVITYGRGRAVVTATGMATEFGHIAGMLQTLQEEPTPLERRLAAIGRVLSAICLGVAAGAVLLGIYKGEDFWKMLLWGISLAVAAVPEALPAVVTGALAIGTTRMAKRHAIVKRLPAVETMGSTTVICTDKTGTLTKNEMTVRRLFVDNLEVEVTGSGYDPQGEFRTQEFGYLTPAHPPLAQMGRIALLCNDASLIQEQGGWQMRGDPTEGALLVLGQKVGLDRGRLLQECPRVAEIPFSSERKRMSTIHETPGGLVMYLKGAPESLLPWCSRILTSQGEKPLGDTGRQVIAAQAAAMAGQALRVLGLAYRRLPALPELTPQSEEVELTWTGLAGMIDPPRPEARDAVRRCHRAGIRVIMVTGDHPDTALAIGRELGLVRPGREGVLTGRELNELADPDLAKKLRHTVIFARVSPEHKLRLVELLKHQAEVVAMTGDGVNDAPALKRADIGVAMGLTGTEVTKETAAMILADDNFATLVAAVEEGRAIFDNIKKYLIYLLSCNFAEILVLTGAFFLGLPLPLLALQILWVNLTTDGLPALALGVDPKGPDLMRRPPRPRREGVFTRNVNLLLAVISLYLTAALIPLFAYYYLLDPKGLGDPREVLIQAQTMVFTTLILAELMNAFNCRSDRLSLATVGLRGNRYLVGAVGLSLAMMVAVIHWPPLARLFHVRPLDLDDWLIALTLALGLLPVVEAAKWALRRAR
jgi:Ca2+-transporting ATPase